MTLQRRVLPGTGLLRARRIGWGVHRARALCRVGPRLLRHPPHDHGKRRRVPLAAGRAKVWRGSARKSGRTDCYRPACRGFWVDHPTSEAVQLAAPADMMTCW